MPAFDVFVSYSRADQDTVERLGRVLRDRGLTVFVDRWYLIAGQSWPEALENHLRDCRAVAVCIGTGGMGARGSSASITRRSTGRRTSPVSR